MSDPILTIRYGNESWLMCAPAGDQITKILEQGYVYEADLLGAILERYGTGGVYVDCGAYIGTHTTFFAAACKADLVIAVEPNRFSYSYLWKNAQLNSQYHIDTLNAALGSTKGRSRISIEQSWNHGGTQTQSTEALGDSFPRLCARDIVTVPPKLIKIDTEGCEEDILEGLRPVIDEYKPVIVAELGFENRQIDQYLSPLGYKLIGTYCYTPTGIWESIT